MLSQLIFHIMSDSRDASLPGSPLQITDPLAMRALAHPARIAIAQHLALDGPATATQCAEFTGLSPSACSYHLRTLAKYGFIETDPASAADRRNRPWRARVAQVSIPEEAGQSAAMRTATRLLTDQLHARFSQLRAQYFQQEARYPAAWQAAAHLDEDVVHVTPDELAKLRSGLLELLSELRRRDLAARPPGARRVHILVDIIPSLAPDGEPSIPPEVRR
jgi:DNA-binding transcriptional ArsR family regulator